MAASPHAHRFKPRRKLKKFEASRVDRIILLNQAGKNSHEHICESLELFAQEVMPEFRANDAEHQAWKQKVPNHEIELEEIDTTPFKDRGGGGKGVAISKLAVGAEADLRTELGWGLISSARQSGR